MHRNGEVNDATLTGITVREETQADQGQVRKINLSTFESDLEANLVDGLRDASAVSLSMVAEVNGDVVGHILYSPVAIPQASLIAGLAPMAVLPAFQRKGVGSEMVKQSLERISDLGFEAVIVLGHPNYYPKFGFRPASQFGLACPYEVPDEVFMALELKPEALKEAAGTVTYHPLFDTD